MNLVLVGARGAGKSTIAPLVAERLGWPWRDLDRSLEDRLGRRVAEVFAAEGEAGFRAHEAAELAAAPEDGWVIAAGGGIVLRPENRARLKTWWCVWLAAPAAELVRRVAGDPGRPALTALPPEEEMAAILARRVPLYEEVARLRIEVAGRAPADLADAIVAAFRKDQAR